MLNWQTPTLAAHAVQTDRDPNHYAKPFHAATAVVTARSGDSAARAAGVSGDAQALAKHIVDLTDQGKIAWLSPKGTFPSSMRLASASLTGPLTLRYLLCRPDVDGDIRVGRDLGRSRDTGVRWRRDG